MGLGCLGFRVLAEVECHLIIGLGSNDVRRKNQQQARAGPEESREWSHSGPIKNRMLGVRRQMRWRAQEDSGGERKRQSNLNGTSVAARPGRGTHGHPAAGMNECVCVCVCSCVCVRVWETLLTNFPLLGKGVAALVVGRSDARRNDVAGLRITSVAHLRVAGAIVDNLSGNDRVR